VISIVYYDNRNTSECGFADTYLAHSWDGGFTFTRRVISTAQSARFSPNFDVRFGDYIGIDSWGGHTVPIWTDERAPNYDMDIYTTLVDTLPRETFSGVQLTAHKGWNMLSLPALLPPILSKTAYPAATSGLFIYDGGYVSEDTIGIGPGYWLRFNNDQPLMMIGDTTLNDSIQVVDGWNMIGSITQPVPVSTINSDPPGIVTSRFFGYSTGYTHADTIEPGRGYWVKVNQVGTLILSSAPSLSASNRIRIGLDDASPPDPPQDGRPVFSGSPQVLQLDQNFPNPFNPTTIIRYRLPLESRVTLRVFNVLGQEVAKVIDAELQSAGNKQVQFNAGRLASGVYVYSVTAGSFSERKKMVLIR
jgi:hypothetical protein